MKIKFSNIWNELNIKLPQLTYLFTHSVKFEIQKIMAKEKASPLGIGMSGGQKCDCVCEEKAIKLIYCSITWYLIVDLNVNLQLKLPGTNKKFQFWKKYFVDFIFDCL